MRLEAVGDAHIVVFGLWWCALVLLLLGWLWEGHGQAGEQRGEDH